MGRSGPIYDSLRRFATSDVSVWFDDFIGDTINLDHIAVATGGGAATAVFAINVQTGGVIRATTGTASGVTTTQSLISAAMFKGDQFAELTCRFRPITAVTETMIEIGFADVVPGSNAMVVNNVTTPTVNASIVDAAVYHYRHTGSTTTNTFVTIGTSITAAKTLFTPPTAIAANTWVDLRVKLATNRAALFFNGVKVAEHSTDAVDYIEGGSSVAIWAAIQATNATSKSLDIDFLQATIDRV